VARGEEKRRREALHMERLREEREKGAGPELPMTETELAELVDHLDEWLGSNECDRTLGESCRWAAARGMDPERVAAGLPEFGGGCDCEVLANMDWADE
jgi:hypothetical protein